VNCDAESHTDTAPLLPPKSHPGIAHAGAAVKISSAASSTGP